MARAVFSKKCANGRINIHKNDHFPPHCNVYIGRRKVKVRLDNLTAYQSNVQLPPAVMRCLAKHPTEILAAWDAHVNVIPTPPRGPQR